MELGLIIPRGKRRAFVESQNFIVNLTAEGYSGAAILDTLKDWGIGFRETDFYKDWRRVLGRPARADLMKYVRKDFRPPSHLIEHTPEYLSRQFRADFAVRGYDTLTGEDIDTEYSLAKDDLADIRDLENEMKSMLAADPEEYPIDIDVLFLRGVKARMPPL